MSSQYPILGNRPIDQWKVTELKEELKRRKLPLKGLKDDLIRRLDEALRVERENALLSESEHANKGVESGLNLDPQPVVGSETTEPLLVGDANAMSDAKLHVDSNESVQTIGEGKLQGEVTMVNLNSSTPEGERRANSTTVETSVAVTNTIISEVAATVKEEQNSGTRDLGDDSDVQPESEEPKFRLENDSLEPPNKDDLLDTTALKNQVSEVSANLGFPVKSDYISNDSFPINEKIELKDNITTDNVELEPNVAKTEMVEPSSTNVIPVDGESHPMDVEEPLEKKVSEEERDDGDGMTADKSERNDIVDMGDSEKLNLDRSSGDDSIEDDALECKPIDSNFTSDEVGDRSEKSEVGVIEDENVVDIVGSDVSTDQKGTVGENKVDPAVPLEKRKLDDEEAIGNTEPLKRQRKWNSDSLKLPEPQTTNPALTSTPKDMFQPARRNFSRSDSSVSDDAPKERVVPPSQKPATNSLRIDRFVRPFTLKAVQELLGKTGKVTRFWMDNIKTHCYVTYSSVEEAVETRNAVYDLQWPPNGGRFLVAEFVEPQEVKMRVEAPPQSPVAPITPTAAAPAPLAQPSPRHQPSRQHLPTQPILSPPPPLSNPPPGREQLIHQAPPPLPETLDPPIVTLDDLFRKTKATPRIYYLPLSEDQVAAKLAERSKNTEQ